MNKKLQVFVSSTYTDLIEERQAAVEAILEAGHIPAGMELFKAGNESQLKTIYKWIDESDVYMLILGGRYGSVEETSGKSYTQLEYEYALNKNIPVFAVVLSQTFLASKINSLGLEKTMEQDYPDKHKLFKSLVMSKIIREVDDSKDIKIAVHSTLNEFINEYDLIGWIRTDTIISKSQTASCNLTYEQLYSILKQKTFTIDPSLIPNCKNDTTIKINGVLCFMQICINFNNGKKINVEPELFDSVFSFYIGLGLLNANHELNKPHAVSITSDGLKLFVHIYEKLLIKI